MVWRAVLRGWDTPPPPLLTPTPTIVSTPYRAVAPPPTQCCPAPHQPPKPTARRLFESNLPDVIRLCFTFHFKCFDESSFFHNFNNYLHLWEYYSHFKLLLKFSMRLLVFPVIWPFWTLFISFSSLLSLYFFCIQTKILFFPPIFRFFDILRDFFTSLGSFSSSLFLLKFLSNSI